MQCLPADGSEALAVRNGEVDVLTALGMRVTVVFGCLLTGDDAAVDAGQDHGRVCPRQTHHAVRVGRQLAGFHEALEMSPFGAGEVEVSHSDCSIAAAHAGKNFIVYDAHACHDACRSFSWSATSKGLWKTLLIPDAERSCGAW